MNTLDFRTMDSIDQREIVISENGAGMVYYHISTIVSYA
jgi:hypothetical protein